MPLPPCADSRPGADSLGAEDEQVLGNGIDPLEIIDQYGADALRFTLVTGNAPGNDMRFYMERVEASRNFANKIWNASRFIMMNIEKAEVPADMKPEELTAADKWISFQGKYPGAGRHGEHG